VADFEPERLNSRRVVWSGMPSRSITVTGRWPSRTGLWVWRACSSAGELALQAGAVGGCQVAPGWLAGNGRGTRAALDWLRQCSAVIVKPRFSVSLQPGLQRIACAAGELSDGNWSL
jgi:hypothetical protein